MTALWPAGADRLQAGIAKACAAEVRGPAWAAAGGGGPPPALGAPALAGVVVGRPKRATARQDARPRAGDAQARYPG